MYQHTGNRETERCSFRTLLARAVGAHDFIVQLPDGYDTVLEEGGENLSQGERRLLSFARVLVANARILVLDEATANIDGYVVIQEGRIVETGTYEEIMNKDRLYAKLYILNYASFDDL